MNTRIFLFFLSCSFILSCTPRQTPEMETKKKMVQDDTIQNFAISHIAQDSIKQIERINIFIQNTGGMYGYLEKNDFKDVVLEWFGELKSLMNHDESKIFIYSINDKLVKLGDAKSILNIPGKLSQSFLEKKGNIQSTDMQDLIQTSISESSENSLSILITDGIVSKKIRDNQDVSIFLKAQEILIKNAVDVASKGRSFQTNIYKFQADFKGKYYTFQKPMNGTVIDTRRPFYFFVFGDPDLLFQLDAKMEPSIERNKNLSETLRLTNTSYNNYLDFKILSTTERLPNQIAVVADFSKLPVSEDYLTFSENYETSNDKVVLRKVSKLNDFNYESTDEKIKTIKPGDKKLVDNTDTHILILEIPSTVLDFNLSLVKKASEWIEATTTDDDSGIVNDRSLENKTFGFSSVVDGIANAYADHPEGKFFFNKNIQLKKEPEGNNSLIWILLGLGILILAGFWVLKNKNTN